MGMLHYDIDCPNCRIKIHVPFIRELEANAIEDFDLAEIPAQDKLQGLQAWLSGASLITLLKYWLKR